MYIYKHTQKAVLKDVDTKSGIITGYFASFDNIDSDGDVFVKGAFKKSIDERGPGGTNQIMHLLQHDTWRPLGKPTVLKEDEKGLYFETKVSNTTYGKDAILLYADGVFNEHSVGFNVIKDSRDREDQVTILREVKLWEGSTVTWGANSETPFEGFKRPEERLKILTKAISKGKYTDETFQLLQIELQQITTLLSKQPLKDTVKKDEPSEVDVFRNSLTFL